MPMHFGWKAHLKHGVPMRRERSGKDVQADLDRRARDAALTWEHLDHGAWLDEGLRADLAAMRASGHAPRQALERHADRLKASMEAREAFERKRAEALASSLKSRD